MHHYLWRILKFWHFLWSLIRLVSVPETDTWLCNCLLDKTEDLPLVSSLQRGQDPHGEGMQFWSEPPGGAAPPWKRWGPEARRPRWCGAAPGTHRWAERRTRVLSLAATQSLCSQGPGGWRCEGCCNYPRWSHETWHRRIPPQKQRACHRGLI